MPIAGEFFWHAEHGHFHFPLASFGLYTVAANGGPGTPVALSPKVGFCIDDSYIYDPTLPNAGALGSILGSCSDPTTLRGLSIGAVDEYDRSDPGQSIPIDGLRDGTYWFKSVVDPNNFLAERDKTHNETDVLVKITGSTVQVLGSATPVLMPPPAITLTVPANGATVSGLVSMSASTGTTSGVVFLVDGQGFAGNVAVTAPFTASWDSALVPNGIHWLAAQTIDATGVVGTSPVSMVTVWGPYGNDLLTALKLQSSNWKTVGRKNKGRSRGAAALAQPLEWRNHLIASATKPQSLDELLVLLWLGRFQVIEELAALVHELDEPAPRGMIALMCGKVLAQSIDALRQERDLNFGGAGIRRVTAKLRDDSAFFLNC